ncbi:hypothetical protein CC78DRAFT_532959 [Lojkania enalia]|uniref:Microbial-type PARG catalytic domain-containing protein n=1 Tax=Lojkania enalia TaxID=147567 RepID=A0A9P4N0E8_9PLEO|nr:hypothetical protein CC78DRAFT_532959 [Didymosphaeria enalia]
MGRTTLSQGLAPPAFRKDARAKQARQIINKLIPAILASNARARKGSEEGELIVDPPPIGSLATKETEGKENGGDAYVKRKGHGRRKVKDVDESGTRKGNIKWGKAKGKKRIDSVDEDLAALSISSSTAPASPTDAPLERKIRIIVTDTLTAAHMLTFPARYSLSDNESPKSSNMKQPNTLILNMASPLRPGGGVLTGATSQEEFLCARTTLLPSLKESFYRLPEYGGIFSPNVLVFRNSLPLFNAKGELGRGDRFWVDVVSAGMLRFPELEGDEDGEKRLGEVDRAVVEKKMRAVLRIAGMKGGRKVVLGAWGCGAYGNPVKDIAHAWRRVLGGLSDNSKQGKGRAIGNAESWNGISEVVFAISSRKMASDFAEAFGGNITVEAGSDAEDGAEEEEEGDQVNEELRRKIQEIEGQLAQVWNPDLKSRMGFILEGLRAQLKLRESGAVIDDNSEEDDVDGDEENNKSEAEESSDNGTEGVESED